MLAGLIPAVCGLVAASLSLGAERPNLYAHRAGIWEIAGSAGQKRWIVIHHLEEARKTGVFHIEVIARKRGKPGWAVKHLCSHMAITAAALERSVVRPLATGAVYPESFDDAFARWKASEGPLCTTSVLDCLEAK